jgi:deoxyribonuclease-1-like protein
MPLAPRFESAFLATTLAALLVSFLGGCGEDADVFGTGGPTASVSGPPASVPPAASTGHVTIATFNIQVYGVTKAAKPEVMRVLANVIRRFDVVAIQEIRATDQTVLSQLVDLVNADGRVYDSLLGPRIGRTSSKEQYAYVFDTARIELEADSVYTIPDASDRLHREPLVARFRTRSAPRGREFTFTLVDVHTDPDEVRDEVDLLDEVIRFVRRSDEREDDVILLGDLNADERHLGQLASLPNVGWAISGLPTNTRRTETYDNLVFDRRATSEYTGRSGVLDLEATYGLSREQALEVSDHLPVWAEFTDTEAVGAIADRSPTIR